MMIRTSEQVCESSTELDLGNGISQLTRELGETGNITELRGASRRNGLGHDHRLPLTANRRPRPMKMAPVALCAIVRDRGRERIHLVARLAPIATSALTIVPVVLNSSPRTMIC